MDTKAYAAYSKKATRLQSSSGGIFTEIAAKTINEGGYVAGVVFDDDFTKIKHTITNNISDIGKMRGSKYISSNLGNVLNEVVSLSKTNKVLFTGTPCQVAALNSIEQNSNIITCENICYGVASPYVFQAYLNYISKGKKIISFTFRNKKYGWYDSAIEAKFEDGSIYFKNHNEDPFMKGFFDNAYIRKSCHSCPLCALPRKADITLGDYWGVSEQIYDEKGISLVLTNTEKGEELFNSLDIWSEPTNLLYAITKNPRIVNGNKNANPQYTDFQKELEANGWEFVQKKYFKVKLKTKVKNFVRRKILRNIVCILDFITFIIHKLDSIINIWYKK
jgi:hypothetical protein